VRYLKYERVVLGHDDEPIRASFDEKDRDRKMTGDTIEVFKTFLDSYQPSQKFIIAKPGEIDGFNASRRTFKRARAELEAKPEKPDAIAWLRDEPYIRFDGEHFTMLRTVVENVGPIMLQLFDHNAHLLRILDAALDDKKWDEEQKKVKEDAASANGTSATPVPEKAPVAG